MFRPHGANGDSYLSHTPVKIIAKQQSLAMVKSLASGLGPTGGTNVKEMIGFCRKHMWERMLGSQKRMLSKQKNFLQRDQTQS